MLHESKSAKAPYQQHAQHYLFRRTPQIRPTKKHENNTEWDVNKSSILKLSIDALEAIVEILITQEASVGPLLLCFGDQLILRPLDAPSAGLGLSVCHETPCLESKPSKPVSPMSGSMTMSGSIWLTAGGIGRPAGRRLATSLIKHLHRSAGQHCLVRPRILLRQPHTLPDSLAQSLHISPRLRVGVCAYERALLSSY